MAPPQPTAAGGAAAPAAAQQALPTAADRARALEYFDHLLNATTLKTVLGYHRQMCELLGARPAPLPAFYPRLRAGLESSWRAKALLKKLDARAAHRCYGKARACAGRRVLVVGAGPCGLRAAVEAQLLGAKVVVVEKRDRFSRNNVLHLWPFVIEDLRALGAKKFFGRFCAGAIDHISIRQLQCILLKAALLLGVEVHAEVGFEGLVEPDPDQKTGWRGKFSPEDHPISQYEFDVVLGADGKRNTLEGFKRKEFRGKLAIAITANFINKKTEAEARVEEISGVAFIFNQKFFKDLQEETRIDLENIVYYKDDTHYFVMTAKKASLLEKGVIKQDLADTEKLLAPDNVDREALQNYAREAADFSTDYQMPDLEFAVNHYGQPDVAMFDFTSMYAAEYASKVLERNGQRLLMILVGDSLLEPFWPTGSGCARGFLSSLDAAWAIRSWSLGTLTPLDVLAERESIYRLLAQTTPDNLNKDWKSYTLDPATRYPNLNKSVVLPTQTVCLFDTDNPSNIEKMKRASHEVVPHDVPKKRRRGNVDNVVLLSWLAEQLTKYEEITITDLSSVYKTGKSLCAIIHHYRPDLLDYESIKDEEAAKNNQLAFEVFEKELGIVPIMTGEDSVATEDYLTMASYLTQIYDTFRGEIPHIKHPKLNVSYEKMRSKIPKSLDPRSPPILEKVKSDTGVHCEENKEKRVCKKCGGTGVKKCKIVRLKKRKTEAILNSEFNKSVESVFRPFKLGDDLRSCENFEERITNKHPIILNNSHGDGIDFLNLNVSVKDEIKIMLKKLAQKRKRLKEQRNVLSPIPEKVDEKIQSSENLATSEKTFVVESKSEMFDSTNLQKFEDRGVQNDFNIYRCSLMSMDKISLPKIPTDSFYSESSSKQEVFSTDFCPTKSPKVPHFLSQKDSKSSIEIRILEKKSHDTVTFQKIKFNSSTNLLTISSKTKASTLLLAHRNREKNRSHLPRKRFPAFKFNSPDTGRRMTRLDREIIESLGCRPTKSKLPNEKSSGRMSVSEVNPAPSVVTSRRVTDWVFSHDFEDLQKTTGTVATNYSVHDYDTDITSVTRTLLKNNNNNNNKTKTKGEYDDVIVEERTDVIKCESPVTSSEENIGQLKRFLTEQKDIGFPKCRRLFRNEKVKSTSEPLPQCSQYSSIMEGEENELPESNKRSENSLKTLKTVQPSVPLVASVSRPLSRHKRHVDAIPPKPYSVEKKTRKKRTLERLGSSVEDRQKVLEEIASNRADRQNKRRQQRKYQTEQFYKSMQMLQANAKDDESQPFEDYSIFLYRQTAPKFEDRVKDWEKQFVYVPDHESKSNVQRERRGSTAADEDIAAKIKNLENKWSNPTPVEKKPKDLLRAIGKIDNSDWNIKEIEKKIMENKLGKPSSQNRDKEKVPKWSKEQFLARQTKMEGRHLDRQDSTEAKYADIDKNIKYLDMKLKEGTARDLGQNKVASITEKLTSKVPNEPKLVEKTVQKAAALPAQNAASEFCHFCGKRVYLMERLSAEGRFFHHGCFKCQYCHSQLRLGSYSFDRDGTLGYKFFCVHHYGMQGEVPKGKVPRKPPHRKSPVKKALPGVSGVDLLDRVQTPERIEFANLSNVSSDHDEPLSQMDEDEWTDKNFGPSCAELDDSDEDTSSVSDTDSDDEGAYDDALEEPATKEGTMKWAERWKNSYSRKHRGSESDGYSSSDRSSYYENTSDDSDSDTATEGEEEIRQRELRRQEVRVEPPVVQTDTGTETEIVSDETTSESSSEIQNSATEISTDSEFAQDEPTPTREAPPAVFDDFHVTKTRGCGGRPRKIQVTAGYIQKGKSTKAPRPDIELKLRPLVPPTPVRKAAPFEGYALNRTQSTGGIAAKVSLELKKKYLLGENSAGSIQKSGSASALDNKFKSFQSTISDCQKLLKPASEIGPGMQAFCRRSPMLSPQSELPPPDVTITTITENKEEKIEPSVFQNEPEGRPRSPVHETSITVPEIDWGKNKNQSSDSLSLSSSENEVATTPNFHIPRVEVTEDNIAPDSLVIIEEEAKAIESRASNHSSANSDAPKSISSEKKTLNQPKALPMVENALPEIHKELHVKKDESPENENKSIKTSSGRSSPEMTAALTETETSDWARDAAVSEDDLELDLGDERMRIKDDHNIAKIAELDDDFSNMCPKAKEENKTILTEAMTSLLSDNLDSIEFMDTGTETSSDGVVDSQNGYVLFKNEDDMAEDSLDPDINEAKNENVETKFENTGFCVIADETNRFGSEVIDIKPSDLEKMKRKQQLIVEHDEDSLLVIEKDTTTTEENTCSDSTVKNVTEIAPDTKLSEQLHKQRLEKKLSDLKEQKINEASQTTQKTQSEEFEKHCQRLESKVDFGNAKDSIDVRKSRRKSKSDAPQKPDLIQEESNSPVNKPKDVTLDLSPVIRTPDILYKKENIKKERDINQKLIQEMVLNKMKAENKSLERKKRIRSPYEVSKSSATDLSAKTPQNRPVSLFATPDLLSNSIPLQNSQSAVTVPEKHTPVRPLSVFATDTKKYPETTLSSLENGSMPDLRMNLFAEDFKTPVAPPRQNRSSDVNKTAEKMKEHARARVRLLSNEDLGLSPEDKLLKLREKVRKGKENEKVDPHIQESIESLVLNTERRNSILYSNDTLTKKKKNSSFRRSKSGDSAAPKLSAFDDDITRTKSILEIAKMPQVKGAKLVCKSDPNLLDTDAVKPKKKSKDRERRKSITKLIANIFTKKSPTNGTRGIFSKFSPKTKEISKSCVNLGSRGAEPTLEQQIRRKSFSELSIQKGENTPPPIPPLPANYIGSSINHTDDSSDGEHHWRNREHGSCDTLDRSGALDHSTMSSTGRRTSKSARKAARQAQLKRHRMAQEIQRKLEETEVKTKELEQRGVAVEKALRGEDSGEGSQDEPGLLQEWFDLMRDRSELRRYEKELMVRAQELELEDRHARLQHELRDRLETNESKTERDIEIEERIINEMMEIVSKRDTLLSILEEDKLRYSNEDRDLEEQMLAKGLRLTPIVKTPEK